MNRVNVEDFRRADDSGNVQIALRRRRGADADRLIGEPHMQRIAIDVAVHGDRAYAHLFTCPDDATGNFAAVRDQNFSKATLSVTHKVQSPKSHVQSQQSQSDVGPWMLDFGLALLDSEERLAKFDGL